MNHNERCEVLAKEIAGKRFPMKVTDDCRGTLARFSIYNQTSLGQRKGIIVHMVQTKFREKQYYIILRVKLNIDIILMTRKQTNTIKQDDGDRLGDPWFLLH